MIFLLRLAERVWELAGKRYSPSAVRVAAIMVAVTFFLFYGGDPRHPAPFYSPAYYTDLSPGFGSPQQLAVLIAYPAILLIIIVSFLLSVPFFLLNSHLGIASLYLLAPPLACGILLGYWYLVVLCIETARAGRLGQIQS